MDDPKTTEQIPKWAQKLLEENKEMKDKIAMFEDMAGKNDIASYEDAKKDYTTKIATLKMFKDKIIIGWSDLNYDEYNPKARKGIDENIKMDLYTIDGKTLEGVNFVVFNQAHEILKFKMKKSNQEVTKLEIPSEYVRKYELEKNTINIPTKFLNR